MTVLFAGPAEMRALNARFRGKRRPTDVLSFPGHRDPDPAPEGPHLGDLAIGVAAARLQARRAGHSLEREIQTLLLHGYLHLLGFDHETDGGRMDSLERRIRRLLGLAGRAAPRRRPRRRRRPASSRSAA